MTTGKDYGLPEEYADWVEVGAAPKQGRSIHVLTMEFRDGLAVNQISSLLGGHWFAEPKPKPALPEVGPGAVISYRRKGHFPGGKNRARAIKNAEGWWTVYHEGLHGAPVYKAVCSFYPSHKKYVFTADLWADRWFDEDLLASVDDDGFTVELGGLE